MRFHDLVVSQRVVDDAGGAVGKGFPDGEAVGVVAVADRGAPESVFCTIRLPPAC